MRKILFGMILGVILFSSPVLAGCQECLNLVRGSFSLQKAQQVARCAQNESRNCQVAVSEKAFREWRAVIDFRRYR